MHRLNALKLHVGELRTKSTHQIGLLAVGIKGLGTHIEERTKVEWISLSSIKLIFHCKTKAVVESSERQQMNGVDGEILTS